MEQVEEDNLSDWEGYAETVASTVFENIAGQVYFVPTEVNETESERRDHSEEKKGYCLIVLKMFLMCCIIILKLAIIYWFFPDYLLLICYVGLLEMAVIIACATLDMMEPIRTNAMFSTCVAPDVFRLTDYRKPNPGIRRIIMRQFVFPPTADPKKDMASSNQIN
ncbi:hypothetical protein CDAR_318351 [Caerostris darwini]|uniref:Uncharacterized protein n=1 Tax=Caerostris darwini TaxID=1538125 RepID=A0AAV4WGW9_9ARAC|nr:hypothetical protein CDAR_318351 [Caerostris darwini]